MRFWAKAGWLIVALIADISLIGAAFTYFKSGDAAVVRAGQYSLYFHISLFLSGAGLMLAIASIILILIRLGGLKE